MKRVWAVNHYWRFITHDPELYGDSEDGFDRVAVFSSGKEKENA